jgi:hypothetical protein
MKKTILILVFLAILCSCDEAPIYWTKGRIEKIEYIISSGGFLSLNIEKTVIHFNDGTVKIFDGLLSDLKEGGCYLFEYGSKGDVQKIIECETKLNKSSEEEYSI